MQTHVVNAFVLEGNAFSGNPAGVCLPGKAAPKENDFLLIAMQMNIAETAFLLSSSIDGVDFHLRWFTSKAEVSLCGHGTLAAAHALYDAGCVPLSKPSLSFHTLSGILTVARLNAGRYELDFPLWPVVSLDLDPAGVLHLSRCLGVPPDTICNVLHFATAKKWVVILSSEEVVTHGLGDVDVAGLKALPNVNSVTVTARGGGSGFDIVSRHFAPALGNAEDPVTGSAHCMLIGYWAPILGKLSLRCLQASERKGELLVTLVEGVEPRVRIVGRAHTFLRGTITF